MTNTNNTELSFISLVEDQAQQEKTQAQAPKAYEEALDFIAHHGGVALEAASLVMTDVTAGVVGTVASVADTTWQNVCNTSAYWKAGRARTSDAVAARIAKIIAGK